jgi:hypothetical protein
MVDVQKISFQKTLKFVNDRLNSSLRDFDAQYSGTRFFRQSNWPLMLAL